MRSIFKAYNSVRNAAFGSFAQSLALFFARIALARIFWVSGRNKVEEGSWLSLSENTLFQFEDEPFNRLPLLSPEFAAHLTTYAEHLLPILLVLGLATRLSALGLLIMTLVIQLFIFPEAWWPTHSLWTALSLILIAFGGGLLSIDAIMRKRFS